jgi:hypothetical protein
MTRPPVTLRTADVLAQYPAAGVPLTSRDLARQLGVSSTALSGHITFLCRQGKLVRIARGVYARRGAA